jgi:N6-adenosine-specific RNA methylase IME4
MARPLHKPGLLTTSRRKVISFSALYHASHPRPSMAKPHGERMRTHYVTRTIGGEVVAIDERFRTLLLPLSPEERSQLEQNILQYGCLDPIKLYLAEDGPEYDDESPIGVVIDGHNRLEICYQHGLPVETVVVDDLEEWEDAYDWIIDNQLGRRNVTPEQTSYLRGKRYLRERASHGGERVSSGQNVHLPKTAEAIAEVYSVNEKTIRRDADYATAVDALAEVAGEDFRTEVLSGDGKLTKQDVVALAEMEPEKAGDIIERVRSGEAKSLRDAARIVRRADIAETVAVIPDGKFRVIYADPPWKYGDGLTENYGGTQYHYPSMTIPELCQMPVVESAADDAVLFLWVTSPLLEECFPIVKAWGFKYKSSFVWDKVKHNMGHYNSVRHEFLLVCTRGNCTPDVARLFDSVQSIERSEKHSEKPAEFREIIETLYPHGRRLELFARNVSPGWEVYGNQIQVSAGGVDRG